MDEFDSGRRSDSEQQVFGQAGIPAGAGQGARIVEDPIPGQTVPVAGAPIRRRRSQWAIALAVVLCVALVSAVTAFVIVGAATPKSLTAGYAPKSSIAFATVRADLPGDQRDKVASFLGHFPGFQDKAQFDTYYDKALNELTSRISSDFQYSTELKPWMGGELSLALLSFGSTSAPATQGSAATDGSMVMPRAETLGIVAVKDKAKAQTWLDGQLARGGVQAKDQAYAGATLHVAGQGAYALLDTVLLVGSTDAVKASIDTKSKGSLADVANFQAAQKAFSGDRLAFFYLDYKAYMADVTKSANDSLAAMQSAFPDSSMMPFATLNPECLTQKDAPPWMAGSVRVESGSATVDYAIPSTTQLKTLGANKSSTLASSLPGSTIGVMEIHSVGAYLAKMVEQVKSPQAKACLSAGGMNGLDGMLSQVEGVVSGFTWMGDGAVAVTSAKGKIGGGLVVAAPNAAQAKSGVDSLLNMITLANAGGAGIARSEETYKGTTITLLSGKEPGADAQKLAIASYGKLVVAGIGADFVKAVIDTTSATSLASKSGYNDAMSLAGASNVMSGYADVQAALKAYTDASGTTNTQSYQREVKPYLDPIRSMAVAVVNGDIVMTHFVVILK